MKTWETRPAGSRATVDINEAFTLEDTGRSIASLIRHEMDHVTKESNEIGEEGLARFKRNYPELYNDLVSEFKAIKVDLAVRYGSEENAIQQDDSAFRRQRGEKQLIVPSVVEAFNLRL